MYIWVIGRAVPSDYNGMHGSFEFEQAQMIHRRGYKVVYVAMSIFPRTVLKWKDLGLKKAVIDDIPTYNVYLPFGITGIGRQHARCSASQRLLKMVEKEYGRPDIIHVHFPSMWPCNAFERLVVEGTEIVATEHWTEVLKKNINEYMKGNLRWFVENAKKFICVGEPLKQSIVELLGDDKLAERIVVIPNIINGSFQYCEKNEIDGKFIFCAVGRLVECKRFDLLIKAFADCFSGKQNMRLKIVGGGTQKSSLQKLISELGINEQVTLTGVKSRVETAHEIQNCDVLVCSSNLETFGVPVIEGMACGKPIITTDAFAVPSVIDANVGILIEKNNIEQMEQALRKMYTDKNQYNGRDISQIAIDTFGEKAVVDKLVQIYESE